MKTISINLIARLKYLRWKAHKIIVNKPHKNCKKPHDQKYIFSLSKKSQLFILFNFVFKNKNDHPGPKDQDPGGNITKHDPEQKRESNRGYNRWVDLHIGRDSIQFADFLENIQILICKRTSGGVCLFIINLSNLDKRFRFLLVLIF